MFRGAAAVSPLVGTWANKPSSAAQGSFYFATDVGEHGTLFQYGVSRWRVANGSATLKKVNADVTGIANTYQIIGQTLLPAGSLQTGDSLRARFTLAKSGATDSGGLTIYMGAAGTTADTVITGFSALTIMNASGRSAGYEFEAKLRSATSLQKVGNAATTVSAFSGQSTSVAAAATTITDASANALYFSVGVASTGTTDTLIASDVLIEIISP